MSYRLGEDQENINQKTRDLLIVNQWSATGGAEAESTIFSGQRKF